MTTPQRTILITGATSGIGFAAVKSLQKKGFKVALTGRNPEKVTEAARVTGASGYVLDVAKEEDCLSVTREIEADIGPLWGLINNAGIWLEGDFENYAATDIRHVLETNTLGTMLMTHAVLPGMIERGEGTILNVISTGALYCRKQISAYAASKWALRGFTGCLEVECAPKGVRVMGFYPGKVASSMYDTAGVPRDLEIAMSPEEAAHMIDCMMLDDKNVWGQMTARSINDYA
ncbi:MAG: SDR family oxidoreductase [Sneathiella sp.]